LRRTQEWQFIDKIYDQPKNSKELKLFINSEIIFKKLTLFTSPNLFIKLNELYHFYLYYYNSLKFKLKIVTFTVSDMSQILFTSNF
jgi:hypothetical protein